MAPPPVEGRATLDLVQQLSPTLGRDRSEEVVLGAARALGFANAPHLSVEQARAVLDRLSTQEGIVGITARFALSRSASASATSAASLPVAAIESGETPTSPPQAIKRAATLPPDGAGSVPISDLVSLLSPSIGDHKAQELVGEAVRHFTVVGGGIRQEEALAVLEELARMPGLVGVTARFAKARFALRAAGT